MTVKIRTIVEQDISQLILLGQALHQESPSYRLKNFDPKRIEDFLNETIANPNYYGLVAEDSDQLIGYFIGGLTFDFISYDVTAFDYSVYVLPDKRKGGTAIKLFKAFETWAKGHNAKYFRVGISTDIHTEKTSKFYQLLGFKPDGVVLEKRL